MRVREGAVDFLLTCHKRENDIDIHVTSPQLTLKEGTLDFISWENEGTFFLLFSSLPHFPHFEFFFAIKLDPIS